MASGETWAQFAASMANAERAGAAQQAAMIVSDLPEFPAFKKMLDLGGGPGLIGIAIVASGHVGYHLRPASGGQGRSSIY